MRLDAMRIAALCAITAIAGCSEGIGGADTAGDSTSASSSGPAPTTGTQRSNPIDVDGPTPDRSTIPAPTPSATGSAGTDVDLLEEGGGETPPTWTAASRASALTSATDVVTAFARPRLSQATWWRDLAPQLTTNARRIYATVDAANVPATRVAGPARLVEADSPYLAGVDVPTDAGVYRVLLARESADARWLAEQITPRDGS